MLQLRQCVLHFPGLTTRLTSICAFCIGMQGLTYKVGDTIYIKYHSSVHDLYLGSSACDFKTSEI